MLNVLCLTASFWSVRFSYIRLYALVTALAPRAFKSRCSSIGHTVYWSVVRYRLYVCTDIIIHDRLLGFAIQAQCIQTHNNSGIIIDKWYAMYKNTLSALHRRYTHTQCPKPMRREVHKPKLAPISDAGFFPHRRQLHFIRRQKVKASWHVDVLLSELVVSNAVVIQTPLSSTQDFIYLVVRGRAVEQGF